MGRRIVGTLAIAAAGLLWAGSGAAAGGGGCGPGDEYCLGPTVTIYEAPAKRTVRHRAVFKFRSDNRDARFRCAKDNGPFNRCSSPRRYKRLDLGSHVFRVQAVSEGGIGGRVARYRWKIIG